MERSNQNVAVIHLVWLPYGFDVFKTFLDSYLKFSAEEKHDLVFLFNGVTKLEELNVFLQYANECNLTYKYFSLEKGQDIEAYFYVAKQIPTYSHFLFLNSFAKILAPGWLKYFLNAIQLPRVGLVGATGSWQSYFSSVFKENKFGYDFKSPATANFRKYKLLLKAFFHWRVLFSAFPNPHVRTNAFMIESKLFLSLEQKPINKKFDAYLFESGKNGLSSQVIKKGYEILIVNKFGETFKPANWRESKTFWTGEQENLLIEDNQTQKYRQADGMRKFITRN